MTRKIQVGKKWYRIILTMHVLERIKERGINPVDILPAIIDCIKMGNVNGITKKSIMLEVTEAGFSLVLDVRKNNVKLVTAINKINCIAKKGTEKVAI